MKSKILYASIIVLGLMFVNLSNNQIYAQATPDKAVKKQTVKYTCTMHAEVLQNEPGNCPKCGMKLVEKKEKSKSDLPQLNDTTLIKQDNTKLLHDTTVMLPNNKKNDTIPVYHP